MPPHQLPPVVLTREDVIYTCDYFIDDHLSHLCFDEPESIWIICSHGICYLKLL
jgi:hypothetical protein